LANPIVRRATFYLLMTFRIPRKEVASEVLRGRLWLGAEWDAHEAGIGNNPFGITHVLNVAHVPVLGCGVTSNGVSAFWVPMSDDGADEVFGDPQSLDDHFRLAMLQPNARLKGAWWHCRAFLQKHLRTDGSDRVLVHCMVGVNRSATIVLAWLMETLGLGLDPAFDRLERCRPLVDPVGNHMRQLDSFEETLKAAWIKRAHAASLKENEDSVLTKKRDHNAWQVKLIVPKDTDPGSTLCIPIKGGVEKVRIRLPEGLGPGSELILTKLEDTRQWDVKVGKVVPVDDAVNGPRSYSVDDLVEGQYENGAWYKANIANRRPDGTYVLNWVDNDKRDRVKSAEQIRNI